jgi:hypothetical protein
MMDHPIHISSDYYKRPIVVYGEEGAPIKGIRDQLSDILAVPSQRIILSIQRFYKGEGEYLDDDIIQNYMFSSGLTQIHGSIWMMLQDP